MKKILVLVLMVCLSGCLERIGKIDRNLKPYGAHWIKKGMTRESRWNDYVECGGSFDLREGYENKPNQTNEDFFIGFNVHTYDVFSCM